MCFVYVAAAVSALRSQVLTPQVSALWTAARCVPAVCGCVPRVRVSQTSDAQSVAVSCDRVTCDVSQQHLARERGRPFSRYTCDGITSAFITHPYCKFTVLLQ